MFKKVQRYSIRKLTIGAASVLIGIAFVGVDANVVHAQTTPTSEAKDATNSKQTSDTSKESSISAPAQSTTAPEQASSQSSLAVNTSDKGNTDNQVSSPVSVAQKTTASQKTSASSSTPASTSKSQSQPSQNSKSSESNNNSATTPVNKPASPKLPTTSPSQPSIDSSKSSQATQILNIKNKIPAVDVRDSKVPLTDDVTLKPTVPLRGRDQSTTIGSGNNETFFGNKYYNLLINGGETLNNVQGQTIEQAANMFNIPDNLKGKVKFEWVYDQNGDPLDATHQYDTKWHRDGSTVHDSIDAFIKITYSDGHTEIKPVTVGIKSEADQYDEEIFNSINHMVTHTIDQEDGHHPVWHGGDGDIPDQYQLTWGYDVNEIVWNNNVTSDQINLFKNVIASFQTSGHHTSPASVLNNVDKKTGLKYATATPGMNIIYKDGSWSEDIRPGDDPSRNPHNMQSRVPMPQAWIYRVLAKNADPQVNPANGMSTSTRQTFVAGDPNVFTSQTAKEQLTNLAEMELFSFNEQYTWVVKDNSIPAHSINGINISGYRTLNADDYKAGNKDFYIMIGYKKVNGVQDGYDIVKIPVNLIAGIHATGENKVFDNQEVTKDQIINDLKNGSITLHSQNDTNNTDPLKVPTTLNENDFEWLNNNKQVMSSNPLYAGTYYLRIKANSDFLKQLATDNPNEGIDTSKDTDITYVIKKASVTPNLIGSNQKDFSYTPFQNSELGSDPSNHKIYVTVSVPDATKNGGTNTFNYYLKDGDYDWYTDNGSTKTQYINVDDGQVLGPVYVGTYYLKLNQQGKQNLEDAVKAWIKTTYYNNDLSTVADTEASNFANSLDYSFADNNYATFKINQLHVNFNLVGHGSKIYDGQPADIGTVDPEPSSGADLDNHMYIQSNYPQLQSIMIEGNDLIWNENDHQLNGIPKDVGHYTLSFSNGFDKVLEDVLIGATGKSLDGKKDNIIIEDKDITNNATYDIKPAEINKVTFSGQDGKTYDAKAGTINPSKAGNWTPSITLPNGESLNIPTWDTNDFKWDTTDGKAPINASDTAYKIVLTDTGKKKLEDANSNYKIDNIDGAIDYTITKANAKAVFVGQGKKTYDGSPIAHYTTPIGVTITASGVNSPVSLTAGTDYVWKKDGKTYTTAPVDAGSYTIELTAAGKKKIKDVNADNLNWTISGSGTYTINKAQATVKFTDASGQTVNYNGKTGQFDSNKFVPTISTNNHLTLNIPNGVSLSLAAGDFTINGVETTTEPTELGTYTIGLSKQGFKKLQSATNNYDWSNEANAKYIIQKAKNISITIHGGQSETYKDVAYNNGDIDVNNYRITLGNGKTYTLQKGDLQFVPSEDPTNVGSYKIELSKQGQDNIAKVDSEHYSYSFDNVTGTFTITKATPTVKFNGNGTKTYDGSAPKASDYTTPISLTITAPGNPTITLGNGDYQFVGSDGTVYVSDHLPVNVGTYTIELTNQGQEKITNNTDNSANLDWNKVDLTKLGTGSFKITPKVITVTYSGSDDKTYDGNPGNFSQGKISWTDPGFIGTDHLNINDLTTNDFDWYDSEGHKLASAPSDVGRYTLKLNDAGLTALKTGLSNYAITISGELNYTINPQPEPPTQPTEPTKPTQPTGNGGQNTDAPTQPTQASQNTKASSPAKPTVPAKPTSPAKPSKPNKPHKPTVKPNKPGKPTKPNEVNKPSKGKPNKGKTTNGPIHGEKNTSKKSSPWSKNSTAECLKDLRSGPTTICRFPLKLLKITAVLMPVHK